MKFTKNSISTTPKQSSSDFLSQVGVPLSGTWSFVSLFSLWTVEAPVFPLVASIERIASRRTSLMGELRFYYQPIYTHSWI